MLDLKLTFAPPHAPAGALSFCFRVESRAPSLPRGHAGLSESGSVPAAGGAELHGLTDALYGNRKFLEVAVRTLDADQDGKLS